MRISLLTLCICFMPLLVLANNNELEGFWFGFPDDKDDADVEEHATTTVTYELSQPEKTDDNNATLFGIVTKDNTTNINESTAEISTLDNVTSKPQFINKEENTQSMYSSRTMNAIERKLDILLEIFNQGKSQIHQTNTSKKSQNLGGMDKSRAHCKTSHMGKEFYLMFPYKHYGINELQILITSNEDTVVEIDSPYNGVSQTVKVKASEGQVVSLPTGIMLYDNAIEQKGIAVRSRSDISVFGVTQEGSKRGEAFAAIPTKFLSTTYYTATKYYSVIAIVAMHDDTRVNITIGGSSESFNSKYYSSGDRFQIYLSRLSTFQIFGSDHLHGTTVSSDKPVGVISGSRCYDYYQGTSNSYCNQLLSYIPPKRSLGNVFIVPQITTAAYSYIYVESDPYRQCTMRLRGLFVNRTMTYTSNTLHDLRSKVPYVVETSIPSVLVQYTSYRETSTRPSKLVIPAISQYSNNYKFITPTTQSFDHWMTIMIRFDQLKGLMVDGEPFDKQESYDFQVVTAMDTLYSVISVNIISGFHHVYHVDNDVTFGLIARGFDSNQAFAFPVGLFLGDRNCTNSNLP